MLQRRDGFLGGELFQVENNFSPLMMIFLYNQLHFNAAIIAKADTDVDREDCCLKMTLFATGEVLQAQPWLHGLSEAGSSPCHRRVPIPGEIHIPTRSNNYQR